MPRPLPRCRPGFTDHIFKTSHGVQLPLRFWPAASSSVSKRQGPSPWLLWVHGGGYTCGKWSAPTAWVSRAFAERGYAVVSVGYRLQPQASLHDMVEDTLDAAAWCHTNLPTLHGTSTQWVVGGASSGATLAAMAAHLASPRPAAFVSVYGLVDTLHYLAAEKARGNYDEAYVLPEAEVERRMCDRDLRNAKVQNPWAEEFPPAVSIEECRAALGLADWSPTEETLARIDMYTYVAKHRNLMDIIYRREQFAAGLDGDAAYAAHVEAHSPYQMLSSRSTSTFPPTFFMHGDCDTVVPAQQSTKMAEKLAEMGVPHQVVYEKGAGHVYDFAFETPEDAGWAANVEPCLDFVDRHVFGDTNRHK